MNSTPGSTGSVSANVECLFMVPTFPVDDQVESARMMAFFSADSDSAGQTKSGVQLH